MAQWCWWFLPAELKYDLWIVVMRQQQHDKLVPNYFWLLVGYLSFTDKTHVYFTFILLFSLSISCITRFTVALFIFFLMLGYECFVCCSTRNAVCYIIIYNFTREESQKFIFMWIDRTAPVDLFYLIMPLQCQRSANHKDILFVPHGAARGWLVNLSNPFIRQISALSVWRSFSGLNDIIHYQVKQKE